jgi:hypothetical protein
MFNVFDFPGIVVKRFNIIAYSPYEKFLEVQEPFFKKVPGRRRQKNS